MCRDLISIILVTLSACSTSPARSELPGLDLERIYHLGNGDKGHLAFVSRLTPEKAPHLAIEVAIKAGMKIVVAGMVPDEDKEYYESKVKRLLDHPLRLHLALLA